MFGRIFKSISNLAASIQRMSDTFDEANEQLRKRMLLTAADEEQYLLTGPDEAEVEVEEPINNGKARRKAASKS